MSERCVGAAAGGQCAGACPRVCTSPQRHSCHNPPPRLTDSLTPVHAPPTTARCCTAPPGEKKLFESDWDPNALAKLLLNAEGVTDIFGADYRAHMDRMGAAAGAPLNSKPLTPNP